MKFRQHGKAAIGRGADGNGPGAVESLVVDPHDLPEVINLLQKKGGVVSNKSDHHITAIGSMYDIPGR